jgi:hypothetical protein
MQLKIMSMELHFMMSHPTTHTMYRSDKQATNVTERGGINK